MIEGPGSSLAWVLTFGLLVGKALSWSVTTETEMKTIVMY